MERRRARLPIMTPQIELILYVMHVHNAKYPESDVGGEADELIRCRVSAIYLRVTIEKSMVDDAKSLMC